MADGVIIRALQPGELDTWLDFVQGVFGVPRAYFARHWGADPWRNLESIRVALAGERIVATLRIFHRTIWLGGLTVAMGGIGEVATDPAYRQRGLSGRLLTDACRRMAEEGMAVSVLFAGLQGHYARHGWVPVPVPWGLYDAVAAPPAGVTVAPLAAQDLPELAALYDARAARLDGTLVRNHREYWEEWLLAEWPECWVVRAAGRLVGYLAARWSGPQELRVEELIAHGGEEALLLGAVVAHMVRDGQGVQVHYPLAAVPGCRPARRYNVDAPMYRLVRPDLLAPAARAALDRLLTGQVGDHAIWQGDWF